MNGIFNNKDIYNIFMKDVGFFSIEHQIEQISTFNNGKTRDIQLIKYSIV